MINAGVPNSFANSCARIPASCISPFLNEVFRGQIFTGFNLLTFFLARLRQAVLIHLPRPGGWHHTTVHEIDATP